MNALLDNRVPPPLVALLCAIGAWRVSVATKATALAFEPLLWLAVILCVTGSLTALAGMLEFRRQRTTVNPLAPDKATSLVSGGVFQYTRNPMYVGLAILLAGIGLALGNWLAFLWLLLFVLYIQLFQIYPEERAMLALFGDQFKTYCAKARRWL
ncbi:MAG: isoprenylcysteine carboxylmethyltransferase family protein [Gammaproteobacteria bacterium]|nr:isoprenylcysteine carboxylmethyltransferase family protein [Gammaproteobacteria bacterium]MBT8150800.1 isoprenylcysteine carboxylmethyltransferase family protein [Gammaproteobacteria bacterium]NND38860.1 isoprenylcysteine carboxylmethyltransferase family protein [Pseudomonadales bacterium]NNL10384.1 isoprenylcysteine carboxylmethyltransferase family protein [Pseudomonadales bacterium]NNM11362.1 isoprenylcysteine carboxylmethyltransferase family protein [Pseudomonadales bacterium]